MMVKGRYLVEMRVNGYSNPTGKCGHVEDGCQTDTPGEFYCCDSFQTTCSDGARCDSYFIYCLRPLGEVRLGCLNNERRAESSFNRNDGPIDFSHNKVLGLDNPQNFSGLGDVYKVRSTHNFVKILLQLKQ